MKRAFDVPEAESDDAGQSAIARAMIRDGGEFFGVDNTFAVTAMIDATLDLASAGELDRLMAEEEPYYPDAAIAAKEAAYNNAHNRGWPKVTDRQTLLKLREVTDHLIDQVVTSARADQ